VLAAERAPAPRGGGALTGLLWPGDYGTAMASLGFQWAWDRLAEGGLQCHRYLGSVRGERFDLPEAGPPLSLEGGLPLGHMDLVAISIAAEADLGPLVRMLDAAGIPPLRQHRRGGPPVIAGGPLTRSNPSPLLALADVVVWGDGEAAMARLLEVAEGGLPDGEGLRAAMAGAPGVLLEEPTAWTPWAEPDPLPVVARGTTPDCAFPGMRLVEPVRGCPRACAFCVCTRSAAPFRCLDAARALAAIPPEEPRVGLVGAGIGDWPALRPVLEALADRGTTVGVSSLRADRVDQGLLEALVRAGTRTITLALDGASDRLRTSVRKGITAASFLQAVEAARAAGACGVKVYAMVCLPGEEDADVDELAALLREASRRLGVVLALSPFVPKRGTPLEDAAFGPMPLLAARIDRLRRGLPRGVRLAQVSPREAWVEHALSHLRAERAEALLAGARAGGRYVDWRRALGD